MYMEGGVAEMVQSWQFSIPESVAEEAAIPNETMPPMEDVPIMKDEALLPPLMEILLC